MKIEVRSHMAGVSGLPQSGTQLTLSITDNLLIFDCGLDCMWTEINHNRIMASSGQYERLSWQVHPRLDNRGSLSKEGLIPLRDA